MIHLLERMTMDETQKCESCVKKKKKKKKKKRRRRRKKKKKKKDLPDLSASSQHHRTEESQPPVCGCYLWRNARLSYRFSVNAKETKYS